MRALKGGAVGAISSIPANSVLIKDREFVPFALLNSGASTAVGGAVGGTYGTLRGAQKAYSEHKAKYAGK